MALARDCLSGVYVMFIFFCRVSLRPLSMFREDGTKMIHLFLVQVDRPKKRKKNNFSKKEFASKRVKRD